MSHDPNAAGAGWAYAGLRIPAGCRASGRRAERWRAEGGEWARPVLQAADWRRPWTEEGPAAQVWALDFPPGAEARTLAAAGAAGRDFLRAGGRIPERGPAAELRIALAKCARYLVAPAGGLCGRWRWAPGDFLPCGALVVAARDDEFLAGVLGSRWLEVWLRGEGGRLGAGALRRFPLPWHPDMPRGALSPEREERRAAVVRAWRAAGDGFAECAPGADAAEALAAAVAAAYGWPAGTEDAEALRRLQFMARRPAA